VELRSLPVQFGGWREGTGIGANSVPWTGLVGGGIVRDGPCRVPQIACHLPIDSRGRRGSNSLDTVPAPSNTAPTPVA
jgi:hypothetical protein